MFNIEHFYWFLSVSLLVNLAPGPDMLYTAARSLSQGIKAGILSALGIFSGCFFHITAAVFGLSTIIRESALLFSIIKYAGAAYLIYLGIKSLFRPAQQQVVVPVTMISNKKIYIQGMITNLLNPKVAIFFLSFLPQFINPQTPWLKEQIALPGLWFAVKGTLILIGVAVLAGVFRHIISTNKKFRGWQERVTGLILVGLGIRMLFSKK